MSARAGPDTPDKEEAALAAPPASPSKAERRHHTSMQCQKPERGDLLIGRLPDTTPLFAAVDQAARFVQPAVRSSRLGARLAPFSTREAALAALAEAGAEVQL